MGLLVQPFHLRVETGRRLRSLGELAQQRRRDVGAVLVVDLVLEAGPEVHGDSADLKFHRHRNHPVGQMHGDLDQRMQAPVPVGLRPRDVVLDLQYGQVGATLPEPVGGGRRVESLVTASGTTRAESRPTPGCLVTAIHHVAAAVPRRDVGCGELHRVSNDSIECNPGVGGD